MKAPPEDCPVTEALLAVLAENWLTVKEITERMNTTRLKTRARLHSLHRRELVKKRFSSRHEMEWRRL